MFTKIPNQGSETMLKDYSENEENVKCSGCAVSYMFVSVLMHVETSGNNLYGTYYVMMSILSHREHKTRPDRIPSKHEIQETIKKD